jgi:uncharacterized lipoprotein
MLKIFAVALCGLLLAPAPARAGLFGEGPKITVDYAPASALIAHGAVQVGAFTYLPSVNGKLKPYELGNTSLADLLLTQNVDAVVREALLKEFRFTGIDISRGPVLSGDIREFRQNDLGGNNITLTIHFSVQDAQGALLYDGEKTALSLPGGGNVSYLDAVMTNCFEALLRDPAFLGAIGGSLTAGPGDVTGSPKFVALTYVPSSAFIVGGAVAIGAFDYLPAASGKVTADQVGNTALGNTHLDRPVSAYVAAAALKEFRLAGIAVESADRTLEGTIVDLFCDDLGSSATWTLDVKYAVKDRNGNTLYQGEKRTALKTQKVLEMLNSLLRRNFEALMLDGDFLKAINGPAGAANVEQTIVPSDGWNWVEWSGYGPRTALVAHGAVTVGAFSYPAMTGKMKPTEIANTALMTTINADKPVAELMHDLTLNELRATGIDVRGSGRVLTGEVQKYKVDDIADPCEWTITVRFTVRDKDGAALYDAVKALTPTNDQHVYNFREMKLAIEALISDPAFIAAIN